MKQKIESYDVVVCGGGMAGFCAALASARGGASTCLIQDRPVLGGNASSEIRVTVHGAGCHHPYARETGIVGEALNAERNANHIYPIENGWTNSVFDMSLYDMAVREPNLTLHLNTSLRDVELESGGGGLAALAAWPPASAEQGYYLRPACHGGDRVKSVRAYVANAEVELIIAGKRFIDCTGDALLAHLAGCEWRMGSESHAETGEVHATAEASPDTMGSSIHIRCIDTGRPAPFRAPDWAMHYEDAAFFYEQGRKPNEPQGGYWWIEIGVPFHTIHDNEAIRHELTCHALGVWDWMKNRDPKTMDRCRNYALEFIGQVPGKRESRRVMGLHFLNENELQRREAFPDECAYGGWFIDLHTPGGLLADSSEPSSALGYDDRVAEIALKYIGPYGIPLRSLVSKDVSNLMMAGRNLSVTHAALGTVRVMATCGLMGQAAGTLAAASVRRGAEPGETVENAVGEVQQTLLRDGCYLPNLRNEDPLDLARAAQPSASSEFRFAGIGAWERDIDQNLRESFWGRAYGRERALADEPCQWFHLAGGRLDRVGLHLHSTADAPAEATVVLRKVDSIWAYDREDGEIVWTGTISVPPGCDDLVWIAPELDGLADGCHRLEVSGPENVHWRYSGAHPYGITGGHIIGSGRYHWFRLPGEFAFSVEPAQPVHGPREALTGVTRPRERSHAWFSDPAAALPQWLELRWPEKQLVRTVELTFPGQLVSEPHWENPFYVAPYVARRYVLEAWTDGAWTPLARESENVRVRRRHDLANPVATDRLRLVVHETHGAPSAGLTEIRCYA